MTDTRWLTSREAADYLGMKRGTFCEKVRAGVIPPGSGALGPRMVRWRTDALDAFMSGAPKGGRSVEDIISAFERMETKRTQRKARHERRVG